MPGLIAVPCLELVSAVSMSALHQMILEAPPGSVELFDHNPFPVHLKREKVGQVLLASENRHLEWALMVDSDMLPSRNTIGLLKHALRDFDIVGALCFARRPPYPVCAGVSDGGEDRYLRLDELDGDVLQVDWVGTGCVMIKRSVFEAVPQPWFRPEPNGRGEDLTFMRAARKAGLRVGCARHVKVGHLGTVNVDERFVRWWQSSAPESERERHAQDLWAKVSPTAREGE